MAKIGIYAQTPDEQKLRFTLTPTEGAMMSARDVGKMLQDLSTIMTSPMGETTPEGWKTICLLAGIDMTPEGKIDFDFLITLKPTRKAKKHTPEA